MMRPSRASRKEVPDGGAGLGACAGREIEAAARESEIAVRNTVREGRWEARKSEQFWIKRAENMPDGSTAQQPGRHSAILEVFYCVYLLSRRLAIGRRDEYTEATAGYTREWRNLLCAILIRVFFEHALP
jgi:hypothetical protein